MKKSGEVRSFIAMLAGVFIISLIIAGSAPVAVGLLNPHIKPEPCESCHRKIPNEDETRAGDYFLLKDTIDATCHICHEYTCCKVGSLHEKNRNHPSDIDSWDSDIARKPRDLPLHNGFITCNTCHLHTKPDGEDYKLVRLVKISTMKNDWTELCMDCHVDY